MAIFKKAKKQEETTKTTAAAPATESTRVHAKHLSKEVLLRPHVSEKGQMIEPKGQYVFWVTNDANKSLVKEEIEKSYGVHVEKVNILRKKMKPSHFRNIAGRTRFMKKAVVTVRTGEKLNVT